MGIAILEEDALVPCIVESNSDKIRADDKFIEAIIRSTDKKVAPAQDKLKVSSDKVGYCANYNAGFIFYHSVDSKTKACLESTISQYIRFYTLPKKAILEIPTFSQFASILPDLKNWVLPMTQVFGWFHSTVLEFLTNEWNIQLMTRFLEEKRINYKLFTENIQNEVMNDFGSGRCTCSNCSKSFTKGWDSVYICWELL